jgi:hypothetical protein
MSRTVTIPDALYLSLEEAVHAQGFSSIAQLLEVWQSHEDMLRSRQEAVARIDALREHLFAIYSVFPDSTEDVREDRARS